MKKNILYNFIYQIVLVIVPLLLSPYTSRVLGPYNIGVFSYVDSVVYIFTLFAMLGINSYGNREIAKCSNNKEMRSKVFWEITIFRTISTMVVIFIFYIVLFLFIAEYNSIFFIQSFLLINSLLDFNWFFYGLEQFKKMTIRNVFIKALFIVSVFMFVKNEDHLYLYVIINVVMNIISNLIMIPSLAKELVPVELNIRNIFNHIKPMLILFVSILSLNLYRQVDKIMIKVFFGEESCGYYEFADKIINVFILAMGGIANVIMPRLSFLFTSKNDTKIVEVLHNGLSLNSIISCACSFGISVIALEFAPLYFGNNYFVTGEILSVLALGLMFSIASNFIRSSLLIPRGEDKKYVTIIICGCVLNIILNIILMNWFGLIGAAFATLISEILIFFLHYLSVKKYLTISLLLKKVFPYFIIGLIMFVILQFIKMDNLLLTLVFKVLIGSVIYIVLSYAYIRLIDKDFLVFLKRRDDE